MVFFLSWLLFLNFSFADDSLNQDGVNALTVAVRACDPAKVAAALKAGAKPNSRNRDGSTPIMWIGYFQNPPETTKLEIAKLLVAHRADVNAKDTYGKSVLSYQVTYGLGKVVAFLMKKGAKDGPNASGGSALLTAIEGGKAELVRILLEGGANPNDERALWAAMHYESNAVRAALLKTPKFDKKSALWAQMAATEGRTDVLKQLIAMGAEINSPGQGNRTALLMAIENDRLESAKALLEGGAKTEIRSESGYGSLKGETALCLASRKGQLELVKALIAKRADVNVICGALESAARGGYAEIVEALVSAGADLKDRYTGHWKALFAAAEIDRRDIGERLIKGGVRVDARDDRDSTPLMVAAGKGSLNMIRLLVSKGANLEAKNERRPISDHGSNFMGTPLGWAIEYKQPAAAALLRELGAKK